MKASSARATPTQKRVVDSFAPSQKKIASAPAVRKTTPYLRNLGYRTAVVPKPTYRNPTTVPLCTVSHDYSTADPTAFTVVCNTPWQTKKEPLIPYPTMTGSERPQASDSLAELYRTPHPTVSYSIPLLPSHTIVPRPSVPFATVTSSSSSFRRVRSSIIKLLDKPTDPFYRTQFPFTYRTQSSLPSLP